MTCPECGNNDPDEIMEWADGYICRDCGCEFGKNGIPSEDKINKAEK